MQEETSERQEFVCTKCGICCKNVAHYEASEFLDRGDGICKYYDENTKLCTIYDFRPEVCRVDKMYKKYKNQMTWDEYLALNYQACKELQEIDKALENRKLYPGKKKYNDILDDEESIEDDTDENFIEETSNEKEEYLDLEENQ